MRIQATAAALLIATFAVVSCQPGTMSREVGIAAIRALPQAWHQGVRSEDIDALLALRTDDVVLLPPDAPTMKGKEALREFYKGLFNQFSVDGTYPVKGTEEIKVAKDLGYHMSEIVLKLTPKAGGDTIEEYWNIIIICRKQPDGSWKWAREIANRNSPPPSAK